MLTSPKWLKIHQIQRVSLKLYKNPLERNFRFVEIPLIKVYTHIFKVLNELNF